MIFHRNHLLQFNNTKQAIKTTVTTHFCILFVIALLVFVLLLLIALFIDTIRYEWLAALFLNRTELIMQINTD